MSADLLRRAAAKMRERAEAATPGPWRDDPLGSEGSVVLAGGNLARTARRPARCGEFEDAEHIASWHPDVALAVADVLDDLAATHWTGCTGDCSELAAARALARHYLGTES